MEQSARRWWLPAIQRLMRVPVRNEIVDRVVLAEHPQARGVWVLCVVTICMQDGDINTYRDRCRMQLGREASYLAHNCLGRNLALQAIQSVIIEAPQKSIQDSEQIVRVAETMMTTLTKH